MAAYPPRDALAPYTRDVLSRSVEVKVTIGGAERRASVMSFDEAQNIYTLEYIDPVPGLGQSVDIAPEFVVPVVKFRGRDQAAVELQALVESENTLMRSDDTEGDDEMEVEVKRPRTE